MSTDYTNEHRSSVVDALSTMVVEVQPPSPTPPPPPRRRSQHTRMAAARFTRACTLSADASAMAAWPSSTVRVCACVRALWPVLCEQGTMVKIYAWYDNEWGYSMRMADLARKVAKDYLGA